MSGLGWTIDVLGCTLAVVTGTAAPADLGWTESTRLEIVGTDTCEGLDLVLPDHVVLDDLQGKVRPLDRPAYRLDAPRFDRRTVRRDGTVVIRIHLPELALGDLAWIDLTLSHRAPRDLVWDPRPAGFAQLKRPRGVDVSEGWSPDRRWAYARQPDTPLVLPHPWADRTDPLVPPVAEAGLSADAAHRRIAALLYVPRALDGLTVVAGERALSRGAVDDRGAARTLAALTVGGPDEVVVGRWSRDADTPPGPGAPEVAVWRAPSGPLPLLHPDDPRSGGVVHLDDGPVPVPVRAEPARPGPGTPEPTWHTALTVVAGGPSPEAPRLDPGDAVLVERTAHVAPSEDPRLLFVPVPKRAREPRVDAPAGATVRVRSEAAWVLLPPGAEEATVSWSEPLTDLWGVLPEPLDPSPTLRLAHSRHAADPWPTDRTPLGPLPDDGDGTWRVDAVGDAVMLADRERLVLETTLRRQAASLPEPGLSARRRGDLEGWDLLGALPSLMAERGVVVHPLDVPGTAPRRLLRARRTRVLTEAEQAAVIGLYAGQQRARAEVVLVHPRDEGPPPRLAPRGFEAALVRLQHDGETRWMDPSCIPCDTWEIRPERLAADALSLHHDATPAPPLADGLPEGVVSSGAGWRYDRRGAPRSGIGAWTVTEDGTTVRWEAEDAEALQLRRWLGTLPLDARLEALARALGSTDPQDLEVEGVPEAGAPIVASAPAEVSPVDPLDLAGLGTWLGDTLDVGHLGLRTWIQPHQQPMAPHTCRDPDGAWHYAAGPHDEGRVAEQLVVSRLQLTADQVTALTACRAAAWQRPPDPPAASDPDGSRDDAP